jgi:hypothetical protein
MFVTSSGRSRPGNDMRDGQLSWQLSSLGFGQCGHSLSLLLSMEPSEPVPQLEGLDGGGDGVGGKWSFVSQEEAFEGSAVLIAGITRRGFTRVTKLIVRQKAGEVGIEMSYTV